MNHDIDCWDFLLGDTLPVALCLLPERSCVLFQTQIRTGDNQINRPNPISSI
jgi:hypothetical protein